VRLLIFKLLRKSRMREIRRLEAFIQFKEYQLDVCEGTIQRQLALLTEQQSMIKKLRELLERQQKLMHTMNRIRNHEVQ
jgi:hypothetical protein